MAGLCRLAPPHSPVASHRAGMFRDRMNLQIRGELPEHSIAESQAVDNCQGSHVSLEQEGSMLPNIYLSAGTALRPQVETFKVQRRIVRHTICRRLGQATVRPPAVAAHDSR